MTGGRLSSNLIINDSTGAKLSRGVHPGAGVGALGADTPAPLDGIATALSTKSMKAVGG